MNGSFVTYYRVSTAQQGRSGLGIEAQQAAVSAFLNGGDWRVLAEFVETESGKRNDRPKLSEAMAMCQKTGATLLIAKLDRLSRDAHFLLGLQKAGVEFRAADMPHADRFVVGIMAMVAEKERQMISDRTKAALAAAKARGVKLGGDRGGRNDAAKAREARAEHAVAFARLVGPDIVAKLEAGMSLRAVAAALTEGNVKTPNGGAWSADAVRRVATRYREVTGTN